MMSFLCQFQPTCSLVGSENLFLTGCMCCLLRFSLRKLSNCFCSTREGVDLSAECLRVREKYGVVPLLPVWELIKGFLGENIFELLVGLRHYILEASQVVSCHLHELLRDGLSGSDFFSLSKN